MSHTPLELFGGPWDGKRIEPATTPLDTQHGTWDDGYRYTYQATETYTPAGHRRYVLVGRAPARSGADHV